MKNIIFIAPPAAGKGTQAVMVSSKYNIPHISTGDILRNAAQDDSERGKYIANEISNGRFVSNEIMLELITERLQQSDCNNGYILDGFPRSLEQAEQYEEILKNLNKESARIIRKVLISATANAENNLKLNKDNLYVKEAFINEGRTLKRMRFGSRGHVDPIKKRTSHVTIVVSERN